MEILLVLIITVAGVALLSSGKKVADADAERAEAAPTSDAVFGVRLMINTVLFALFCFVVVVAMLAAFTMIAAGL